MPSCASYESDITLRTVPVPSRTVKSMTRFYSRIARAGRVKTGTHQQHVKVRFLYEHIINLELTVNVNAQLILGHRYEVYDQKATPEIDGKRHMRVWVRFLETKLLGRPLKPDEYLFPVISNTGLVHTNNPIDHNVVQKHINEFAAGAGLTTKFSTHSFRRGGAQYRFMFCPIGERWSLSAVRWWGGWASGEYVSITSFASIISRY